MFPQPIGQKEPDISSGNGKSKAKSAAKSKAGPSNASAGPSNAGAGSSNAAPRTSRGKAVKSAAGTSHSKIIPGTSRKTPAPKKKKVRYGGQIDKNNHLHLPTIKAKRNGTFLYKKRQGGRRLKPGGIRL